MITAHIAGMPVEESVLQLLPAGAATVTVLAFGVRGMIDRLRRPEARRRRSPGA